MGEIADMMLDGALCEACGSYIGSDAGYPQYCSRQCAGDRGQEFIVVQSAPFFPGKLNSKKTNCPTCRKRVKVTGLLDHLRDVHGGAA